MRGRHVEDSRFRIERRAAPVGAAVGAGHVDRAFLALRRAGDFRRRVDRAVVVLVDDFLRRRFQFRRVVEEIVVGDALLIERRRPARNRLRWRIPLARNFALRHGTFVDRPDRFACDAIQHERVRLLGDLRDGLDVAAVHSDVDEDGRGGEIVVPQAMMQRLEMPHALPGLRVEADDALGEEIVSVSRAAVIVARRFFSRQIDVAEFFVGAQERPHAAVA